MWQWLSLAVSQARVHTRRLTRKLSLRSRILLQILKTTATQQDAVVAPVETQPVTQAPVVDNYDNEPVRRETVSVVNGSGLKAYSVVVGSFGVKSNAEGLHSV